MRILMYQVYVLLELLCFIEIIELSIENIEFPNGSIEFAVECLVFSIDIRLKLALVSPFKILNSIRPFSASGIVLKS